MNKIILGVTLAAIGYIIDKQIKKRKIRNLMDQVGDQMERDFA